MKRFLNLALVLGLVLGTAGAAQASGLTSLYDRFVAPVLGTPYIGNYGYGYGYGGYYGNYGYPYTSNYVNPYYDPYYGYGYNGGYYNPYYGQSIGNSWLNWF